MFSFIFLIFSFVILQCGAQTENGTDLGNSFRTPFKNDMAYLFYVHAAEYVQRAKLAKDYVDDKCDKDILNIRNAIDNYEEWALEFSDTWGRWPVGLLWGHTISMGAYEECVAASRYYDNNADDIHGQYCLARINITKFMDEIIPRGYEDSKLRISYKKARPELFELGICVPSSCNAQKSNDLLEDVLNELYGIDVTQQELPMVVEKYCKYDAPIELRAIDIIAIAFFALILGLMVASSIYDYVQTHNKKPKHDLLIAFSVLSNAPKIFTVKNVNNPNVIHCLNGLRCFSMMWVVYGHGFMTYYDLPHINKDRFYTWVETPFSMLTQNGSLCVDTFFFMSGLLIIWSAFREMERNKGYLNLKMMYFHRYVRLTPVVAVVILYIMSIYRYTGAGPMWMKLGTQDERCANTWWATLLYVQNYVYPYSICISQSWYLAVDTQLYFLSPLVLIPLWKWGKKAVIPIAIFGVLCMVCMFAIFMVNEFTLFRVQDDHVSLRQAKTYYPTHTRIPSWLIGVLFGYYLYKHNRGKQIPLARRWVICGWLLAFGIMLVDIWGPYWRIRPETPNAPIIEGAIYEPLSRSAWAMAIGWIVWACYNGHGGIINDFLSWSFFTGFSRLTYCMYVIHRIVQLTNAAQLQTDTHFSNYDNIQRWWSDFGITLTLSIFATLAFEAPILGIEKAIFGRGKAKPVPAAPKPIIETNLKATTEVP